MGLSCRHFIQEVVSMSFGLSVRSWIFLNLNPIKFCDFRLKLSWGTVSIFIFNGTSHIPRVKSRMNINFMWAKKYLGMNDTKVVELCLAGPVWALHFQFRIGAGRICGGQARQCWSGWWMGMVGLHGMQPFSGDEDGLSGCNSGWYSVVGNYCSNGISLVCGVSGPAFLGGADGLGCPFMVNFFGSVCFICEWTRCSHDVVGTSGEDEVVNILDGFDEALLHVLIFLVMDDITCSALVHYGSSNLPGCRGGGGGGVWGCGVGGGGGMVMNKNQSPMYLVSSDILSMRLMLSYCLGVVLGEYDFLIHICSVGDNVAMVGVHFPVRDITETGHQIYMSLWWIMWWFDQVDCIMYQMSQLCSISSVDLQSARLRMLISPCLHLVLAPARC